MRLNALASKRETLRQALLDCRQKTLTLVSDITPQELCQQSHPDFSPIGWHLGHIAFTEGLWILEHCAGIQPPSPISRQFWAADGLPKTQRQALPPFPLLQDYLDTIRQSVLTYLETAPLEQQERLWWWLLQHESQHNETIAIVLAMLRWGKHPQKPKTIAKTSGTFSPTLITIPSGEFPMGRDDLLAQDNERPPHWVYLPTYQIDSHPVTCQQYRQFMAAGGYHEQKYWSEVGWQWLQQNPITQPYYWREGADWDYHPVCGVSWYEAEAYARFVGKRLPSEAEWEKAATWHPTQSHPTPYPWGTDSPHPQRCNFDTHLGDTTPVYAYPDGRSPLGCWDMLGNVWEWTDSWFAGYPGFEFYPYRGYSEVYFDQQHRVMRGGSWITRPWGLRSSFRNWYHPWVRQMFVGFRCAVSSFD
ncbi:SUMF1/EgtB/PvdO family nonheme iron enzyme [Spirulina subsalsa FACHB-351]|uniref:SUMF1/EgtB/PvdO family nonheme iron enzyme n=1 Tax=Spirulina subsalsa FACHB-351 TaxID=234711 RepID=A0ABT3L874_9CYAN|nr:SUMF1/EgtB/PvdO family nonheme iron enzyme [Spirulina subsalsa FACHB-351]